MNMTAKAMEMASGNPYAKNVSVGEFAENLLAAGPVGTHLASALEEYAQAKEAAGRLELPWVSVGDRIHIQVRRSIDFGGLVIRSVNNTFAFIEMDDIRTLGQALVDIADSMDAIVESGKQLAQAREMDEAGTEIVTPKPHAHVDG